MWFNPPFSKNVATKIRRYFLNLSDKHFPQDRKFHKIFDRNNIKVSYSYMPNFQLAINSHNRKFLHSSVNNQSTTCNCINKTDCSLQEKCSSENTLHQADISSGNFQTRIYYGISETIFKTSIGTIKNSSTTKSTKMTRDYRMNSGKLKLQKKSQS